MATFAPGPCWPPPHRRLSPPCMKFASLSPSSPFSPFSASRLHLSYWLISLSFLVLLILFFFPLPFLLLPRQVPIFLVAFDYSLPCLNLVLIWSFTQLYMFAFEPAMAFLGTFMLLEVHVHCCTGWRTVLVARLSAAKILLFIVSMLVFYHLIPGDR